MDAIDKGLPATICAVISNNPKAYGLQRAAQANIPNHSLSPKAFTSMQEYELTLQRQVDLYQPDLIVLAGYMCILSAPTVQHWGVNRIVNLHPSLLPKYPGLHTHARVLKAKEKYHGVSVHFVTAQLDAGPIIAQRSLEVLPNETLESLEARIHTIEHALYPEVIDWFARDNVKLINGHVVINGIKYQEL